MKSTFNTIWIVAVTLFFCSCSEVHQVYTNTSGEVGFNQFKTYAWLPVIDTSPRSLFYYQNLQFNIMQRVNYEMHERGYRIDTINPDLLVLLHLRLRKDDKQTVRIAPLSNKYSYYYKGFTPSYWNPDFYLYYNTVKAIRPTDVTAIPYTTGTLVIDVIQNEKDKLIWRGWSMTPVKSDFTKRDFIQIVDDLFQRYPVDKRNRIAIR